MDKLLDLTGKLRSSKDPTVSLRIRAVYRCYELWHCYEYREDYLLSTHMSRVEKTKEIVLSG